MFIKPARQTGVTLIELILSIVIISIAAVGAMQLLNFSSTASTEPVRRKQALLIAEALMDEVRSAGFTFCMPGTENADRATAPTSVECPGGVEAMGPEAGDARPFDNVNDYKSSPDFSFTDASGAILDSAAVAMTRNGYQATVKINGNIASGAGNQLGPATAPITSSDGNPVNTNALLITVRVKYGNGADDYVELDTYRTRYAPAL